MNTLEKILTSKARAAIFTILFGIDHRELHLREIQRRSGLAVETIRKETHNLEDLGLIVKHRDGNRTYFTANTKHPLYHEIHQMVIKTSGLTMVLQQALNLANIKIVFVFGSIAQGNETDESDIDLFVIGNVGLRALSNVLKEPANILGREINPHVMTLNEFITRKQKGEHFVTRIINSPKLMIIGSENEFTELVG